MSAISNSTGGHSIALDDEGASRLADLVEPPGWTTELPSWVPAPHNNYTGPTFERKTYGRIFVRKPQDVERVIAVLREMDPYEVDGYMPDGFVGVYEPDAALVYGHKFDAIRTDALAVLLWERGIEALIITGVEGP